VSEVTPDGPAQRAGIEGGQEEEIEGIPVPMGDVITRIAGENVTSPDDVIGVVNSLKPGDGITLTVVTPGKGAREVTLTVGTRPEDA
jgi:S1-C subfamily serine protease